MKTPSQALTFRRVAVISRPFWWVNTAVPFLAGALLADSDVSAVHLLGFLYFLFSYNLLMYGVNDIYDYESDIKNPRKNGSINGSVLNKALHRPLWLVMAAMNIPFAVYFLSVGSRASNLFFGLMIFLVFAYSIKGLRFKEIPILDSFTSAFHYSSPFIFGLILLDAEKMWFSIFAAFFLWVAGNHAFGAIQDIKPDREAGISSVATRLGPKMTLYFSMALYVLAGLLPVVSYGYYGLLGTLAVLPYLVFVLLCLPDRSVDTSPKFSRYWTYFLFTNYVIGGIGTMFLLYFMYNR